MSQCLGEPFGEGIHVWGHRSDTLRFTTVCLEHRVKTVRELGVVVQNEMSCRQAPLSHLHRSVPSLLGRPFTRRVGRNPGNERTTTANVDEEQQVEVDEAGERRRLRRKEIASPQRGSVTLHELVPGSFSAFGTRIETGLLHDVDHRGSAHATDAEFLEFTEDTSVTPRVLLREFHHEFADLLGSLGTTRFASGLLRRRLFDLRVLAGDPTSEGAIRNDGDEVFESRADLLSEFDEASAFAIGYGNAGWQLIS